MIRIMGSKALRGNATTDYVLRTHMLCHMEDEISYNILVALRGFHTSTTFDITHATRNMQIEAWNKLDIQMVLGGTL
jgi:hypothetical protein